MRKRQPIVVEARLSEPPEVRERIAREATAELIKAGAAPEGTSVTVISAYKQGYSWLYDVVRPELAGKAIRDITIRFAEIGAPPEWKQQAMFTPTRWLLEVFPIDEVLARDLKLDLEADPLREDADRIADIRGRCDRHRRGGAAPPDLRTEIRPPSVLRAVPGLREGPRDHRLGCGDAGGPGLVDRRIVTDLERFWDHFQTRRSPAMYDYVMALSARASRMRTTRRSSASSPWTSA